MNKLRFLFSVLLVTSYLLAACSTLASQPAKSVIITFYKRGYTEGATNATSVANAKAVEMFHKSHPNIVVKIVGIPYTQDGTAQLEAALAAGIDINVFSVNQGDLPRYARQGKLSDLEPYLTGEDKSDFYASGFQAVTVDGKIYAWPIWVTALSIYANTELFKERGVPLPALDKPWTWDEFVAAAKQLTFQKADGTQIYGFGAPSRPDSMAYQALWYIDGGRVLSPDGKRFVQNSPEAVSALQKIADLALAHQVTPPDFGNVNQAATQTQFKKGTLAMTMDTPSFTIDLEKQNFTFAMLPTPLGKLGKVVTTGAFGMYAVFKTSDPDKLRASHEFARYITGSQVAKDVPDYQLAPGLRRSNTSYATSPNRAAIAKLVAYGVYEPPADVPPDIVALHANALQAILLGEKTPQQAMDEVAPVYQKALDASSR
jgi:multiple sugar transport system substrate-binding protein